MKCILMIALAVTAWCSLNANAQEGLIASDCGILSQQKSVALSPLIFVGTGTSANSCETIGQLVKAADVVHMAIMPALIALKTPGVREELAAQLAALGLTFANPAVLGVTVLGAFGYVTIYLVLKTEVENCNNLRMQTVIKQEVEQRFKLKYTKPIDIVR